MPMASLEVYEVVLSLHIAATVVAFGPIFGYALLQPVTERRDPRGAVTLWKALETSIKVLFTPAAIVAFAAGIYLTLDRWQFSDPFVSAGMTAMVVLFALAHGILTPNGRRAIELAERDIRAAGDGEVRLTDEYLTASRRVRSVGALSATVVVATIFLMVVKP